MMYKLCIFIHKFDNMRYVYINDSSVHAKLGNTRDKFTLFRINFYREMIVPKDKNVHT